MHDRDGLLPNPNGTNNPATVFAITSKQPNNTATGSFDYVGSNRVFFNTKVNYLEYDRHDNGIPNEIRYIFAAGSNNIYETRPDLIQSAGYTNILTNQAISKDKYSRIGWTGDSTFFVNAAGQHTVKGGVQFERIENDVKNVEQQPNVSLGWDTTRTTLAGAVERGKYGYYSWRTFGTLGKVSVNNLGLFLQDAWTVNNRLTINAGIRTEREDVPSYRPNLAGIKFSFGDKFAPRAGFAYDIKGNGKWKAFGSWGVFYDTMKLELPRGSFGGDVWVEHYYTLDTLDWNTIGVNGVVPGPVPRGCRLPHPVERSVLPGVRSGRSKPQAVQAAGTSGRNRARARQPTRRLRPVRPQAGRSRDRGRRRRRPWPRRGVLHRQSGRGRRDDDRCD